MTPPVRPTLLEIDLEAVRHNVRTLDRAAGEASVCAVVKADGYGHGAVEVAGAAVEAGAEWLAVALVEEGEQLRAAGIDVPILLFTEPPAAHVGRLLAADLTPALYTAAFGAALDRAGRERGKAVQVHAKLDSGMGRVGVPEPDWEPFLRQLTAWDGIEVAGLWTHLARADEPDVDTTAEQLDRFDRGRALASDLGLSWRWTHVANSAATLVHPRAHLDLVRPGIAVYGLSPSAQVDAAQHGLRPAMRLTTDVRFVKQVPAGTGVSYGHRWAAPADGWVATLQVGYGDGVPRLLTNRGEVLIGGVRRPIAGAVCMDQIVVWCGDDQPAIGDEVVLLGAQGDQRVRVEEWAAAAGTITYEIATQLTCRLPRHHH